MNPVIEGTHITTTYVTGDYDLTEEPAPFLVDGIIHESMTLLYGQTCSGKSTLAASLAIALANGNGSFLGREVTNDGPMTVGIVTGDPSGGREYKRRIVQSGQLGPNVGIQICEPHRPTRSETWEEVHEMADNHGWQFIIVDNLSSFIPGSLNDDTSIKTFYEQIEDFPRRDIPLLLVAHTSDKWGDHGPSRIPMGSSYIRFGPRWWINAYRQGGGLNLSFDGNEGIQHSITVNEPDGNPRFDVIRTTSGKQGKSGETNTRRDQISAYVLGKCQALNGSETALRLAKEFGGSKGTHAANLSRKTYGVKRDGERWVKVRSV